MVETLETKVSSNAKCHAPTNGIQPNMNVLVPSSLFDSLTLYVGRRVEATAAELNRLREKANLPPTSQAAMDALYSPIADMDGRFGNYSVVWQLLATANGVVDASQKGYADGEVAILNIPHTSLQAQHEELNYLSRRVLPQLIQCEEQFLGRTELRLRGPPFFPPEDWIRYLGIARREIEGYRTLLSSVRETLGTSEQRLNTALRVA